MIVIKKNYFDGNISRGFIVLYASKSIIRMAGGFFGLFLPIFIYGALDENFHHVILYYVILDALYVLNLPNGAMFLNKFGFRRALRFSSFLGALFYFVLQFAKGDLLLWFLGLSIVFQVLFRLSHWIPFHVDFAKFTDKKNRGREVGLLDATTNVIGIIAPLAAGIILVKFGFGVLFVVATVVHLASFFPLVFIPDTNEKYSWKYIQTWKEIFSKDRRGVIIAYVADGFECSIGTVVWPIFIFELLNGDYVEMGVVTALITGFTIILQLVVGKYSDKDIFKGRLIRWGSWLYAIGWGIKIFIVTAFQIFMADAYHKMMKIFLRIPFDALTYETAADQGHYVDEFTVIHEMAIGIGRVLALIVIFALIAFMSLKWLFILAAVASVLLNLVRSEKMLSYKRM